MDKCVFKQAKTLTFNKHIPRVTTRGRQRPLLLRQKRSCSKSAASSGFIFVALKIQALCEINSRFLLHSDISWPLLSHWQGSGKCRAAAVGALEMFPGCLRIACLRLQEHLHFVTEICQDEVFILDHEGPVVSQGVSTGMPDLVVEPTTGYVSRN